MVPAGAPDFSVFKLNTYGGGGGGGGLTKRRRRKRKGNF